MNKQCNICKEIKDILEFGINNKYKDGIARRCIECHRKKSKEFRTKNPDKIKQYSLTYLETHPNYAKDYYIRHKDAVLTRTTANQKKNKEIVSKRQKRWQKKHPEKCAQYSKKYLDKPGNRERSNIRSKKYHKEVYKDKHIFYNSLRRDKKKNFDCDYTYKQKQATLKAFNHKCFNCNSIEHLAVDHYYPLSDNNSLSLSNAIILCRKCNSSKSDKLPEDFFTIDKWQKAEELMKKAAEIFQNSL